MTETVPRRVRLVRGQYYWRPTPAIRAIGFHNEPLGVDKDAAFARARRLNDSVETEQRALAAGSDRAAARAASAEKIELVLQFGAAVYAARVRARAKKMAFTLSPEDIAAMATRAAGRCELTGIPFDLSPIVASSRNPFAPSVDRINSRRGYEPDNVRLVLAAVNYALSDWGDDVFSRIAFAYVERQLATRSRGAETPQEQLVATRS